ncbi:MAG: type I polyketide synthase [Gammaproteobacteria bacterium]
MEEQVSTDKQAMPYDNCVAVIAMHGRFPGANDLSTFWHNIATKKESLACFSVQELVNAGIDKALLDNPNYIKTRGIIGDVALFDAKFFGYSPAKAEITDPQHRLFIEIAWEALEKAGYASEKYAGTIGVYAGSGEASYLIEYLRKNIAKVSHKNLYQILIANSKTFLSTKVSYKLNLTGPSLNINTACSTSLVAIITAYTQLLSYECDIALAGGVSIWTPQESGYLYRKGNIYSSDGHCRAFDANASGTVMSSGVGVVVLKRLEDAIADGDNIEAIILGGAINNDGADKVGFTAPSVNGQANCIAEAIAMADVNPESIGYVEAHGTGTLLGDPIEVAGLTKAFAAYTGKKNFCALGSVKSNIGHTDSAAGVAGFIKTVLALKHRKLPPNINFIKPNANIDFERTPFFVNTELKSWQSEGFLRAGVSSFGFGGTNAHLILQEAPMINKSSRSRKTQIILLSAKTQKALDQMTKNLGDYFVQKTKQGDYTKEDFADAAFTLQVGRKDFPCRRAIVCKNVDQAITFCKNPNGCMSVENAGEQPSVVFMFPGQGTQYVGMGKELYESELVFKREFDRCCDIVTSHVDFDLKEVVFSNQENSLDKTEFAQLAIFAVEYALAKLFIYWGIEPKVLIGHSLGEYVAAHIAGVFSLEDVLKIILIRSKLINRIQKDGAMLAVFAEHFSMIKLHKPKIPFISNVTGKYADPEEVVTSDYWVKHLRDMVRFSEGIKTLLQENHNVFLELGPGNTLTHLLSFHVKDNAAIPVINTLLNDEDDSLVYKALAVLWLHGQNINWQSFYADEKRHRVILPTYPFGKSRYWIDDKVSK